jgi:fatty-acyl-CoA synthase
MRLHDSLEYWARVRPDAEFATYTGRRMTYAEADAEANRIAHALVGLGLEAGDRAAFLAKNCIEYVTFFYGASKAGVVPVPLNYRLAAPEWQYILDDAQAKLLVARGTLAAAVDAVRPELPHMKHCLALGADVAGWRGWGDFLAEQPATSLDRHVCPDSDLYQMYTSGTTGRPKGAVLTHRAVCANLVQAGMSLGARQGDRALIVAPLYHAAAAITSFVCVQGGASLYIQEEFEPGAVVRALSEEQIQLALLVPAMIQFCLTAVPGVADRRFDALRIIMYGASAISEPVLRRACEVFKCDFLQAYGMTETTACATNLLPEDHRRALRERPELLLSCGRPVLGTEVRVVDDQDRPLPAGEIGEIVIRGPQLMRGYWNLDEATAEALRDGWMHTGDAGRFDAEGYLYIQDRVKDMIVSGAENVYPREIEEVLFQHPAVADAAVIGVPDERWGEVVKAILVLRDGAHVSADDIVAHCRGKLAGYKCPRSVDFLDVLPRNPSGKILKKDLRAPYWAGRKRGVN